MTLSDIRDAAGRISGLVHRTPLRLSPYLSEIAGREIRLKLETMQDTGSFKIRGATNALLALPEAVRARGILTVSSGNHGRSLAFAAKKLGIKAVVYVSELVPAVKTGAIRALGAEVVIAGASQDQAEAQALARIERDGLHYLHPFDDPDVIAGQGTVGLEILEDLPDTATLIVPLSGGGLLGGIAVAAKTLRPDIRVIGVSMAEGAAMYQSLRAGRPVPVEEVPTLADALGGGIGLKNRHTFELVRRFVDDTVLASEEAIADAMWSLLVHDRIVAEGGGAVPVAALQSGNLDLPPGPVVLVINGCNVDMTTVRRVLGGA